jgi:hypothetical protein
MPIDYNEYPDNWKTEIRPEILKRANNKCEWCGLPNGEMIIRGNGNHWIKYHSDDIDFFVNQDGQILSSEDLPDEYDEKINWTTIVLTIAHIENPDPMDCRPENLAALCQRCHHKSRNTPAHRAWQKRKHDDEVGQLRMFED